MVSHALAVSHARSHQKAGCALSARGRGGAAVGHGFTGQGLFQQVQLGLGDGCAGAAGLGVGLHQFAQRGLLAGTTGLRARTRVALALLGLLAAGEHDDGEQDDRREPDRNEGEQQEDVGRASAEDGEEHAVVGSG